MKHDTPPGRYRLLVFDWDGTLIDSIDGIVCSLQSASLDVCGERVSDTRARSVIGLGLREAIETLHPELESAYIDRLIEAYKQHYLYENPIESKLFAGVREMLEQLREYGYQLAIATGKSRLGLDRVLAQHDLAACFSATRCAGENLSKPHPEMLLDLLASLRLRPQQALMIGDSAHDLQMANNAGVDAVGVTRGVNNAEELRRYDPVACLDNVTDLIGFLSHNIPGKLQNTDPEKETNTP